MKLSGIQWRRSNIVGKNLTRLKVVENIKNSEKLLKIVIKNLKTDIATYRLNRPTWPSSENKLVLLCSLQFLIACLIIFVYYKEAINGKM